MDKEKRCVVITPETLSLEEIDPIRTMLDIGCWRIHIRKPNADKELLRRYLDRLCQRVDVTKLSMHYYHDIALEYGFGGLHGVTEAKGVVKSISCHTLEEVENAEGVDYLFISPLFDSISKQGYKAAIDIEKAGALIRGGLQTEVVALGGIEKSNLTVLDRAGFRNIALLGAVWRGGVQQASANFNEIYEKWR